MRSAHPDAAPEDPDATRRAGELNRAFDVLVAATDNGRSAWPAPSPPNPAAVQPSNGSAGVVMHAGPGDVFVRLLDAAYEIGNVSYIDPEAGLIQVLLDDRGDALLLIDVDFESEPARASFTLDSQSAAVAPSIDLVVEALSDALRAQA